MEQRLRFGWVLIRHTAPTFKNIMFGLYFFGQWQKYLHK